MELFKKLLRSFFDKLGFEITRKKVEEVVAPSTYFEVDQIFNPLYELAREKTQMAATDNLLRRQRHYTLCNLLRNMAIHDGDVCELGCWRGLSAYQLASQLASRDFKNYFCIFDSFEGLSEVDDIDRRKDSNIDYNEKRNLFACSDEIVRKNLKEFSFIRYFKGWIPDRFEEVKDRRFSFVHIDLDLYQPIRDSIRFFYPRLNSGGVMVFDDYGCATFPGAKVAIDEALKELDNPFFLPLPSGQAFIFKQ
jgi:O-methyltransferase